MKVDMMDKNFFILLLGIFMIGGVFALGVTPARTTLDFEENLMKSVSFDVLNSGGGDINVVFSAQGDLSEYITLPIKEASISGNEVKKSFNYELNFPVSMEPGLHTGEIFVMQLPDSGSSSGSQILATLAVATQVHLYVPYPGKYAKAKMYVYGAGVGENIRFVIPVISAGEFDLTSVRANVDVFNSMGEKVSTFDINSVIIPSGERKELVYNWKADVSIGDYIAKASVIYDEGTIDLEEKFSIGSEELELQEINVGDFSLGQIAKLEMLVENKWSEDIGEVHIETNILNNKGEVVSTFQSAAQDIGALSKEVFVSYWDTAGVLEGDYDAEVSIDYADKSMKKNLKFEVSEDELVIVGLGYVISNEGGEESNTLIIVLIVIIVLMVIINLLWFLMFRKKLVGKK